MADDESSMSAEETAEDESPQALVSRDFFQGKDLKIDGKCEVRIKGIYDDEVAIAYVPHKKKKDGKDKDSNDDDDDDDKPKRRRRDRDDSELMRESLSQMDVMAGPPAPGGY